MNGILIGRIWGIPIRLHLSWFVIIGLLSWSLAQGFFPQAYPMLSAILHWVLAVLTSLMFAASVLLHELGHSYLALRNQIPVRAVTLFIFGGVAQIEQAPKTPGAEFRIAIAGPAVSAALAALFFVLWQLDRAVPLLAAPSEWLFRINLALAGFNMIPGFPLDGGRVLRSIVWRFTKSFDRATRIAASAGQVVAFGFIAYGVFTILQGNFFNGLWLSFIGWFLQNAAASSFTQVSMQRALEGANVGQLMNPDLVLVETTTTLERLVEDKILTGGYRAFLVQHPTTEEIKGMITLSDLSRVPRAEWSRTTTADVMTLRDQLATAEIGTSLKDALRLMAERNVAQLPVLEEGKFVGMLSRDRVLNYIRTRTQVGI